MAPCSDCPGCVRPAEVIRAQAECRAGGSGTSPVSSVPLWISADIQVAPGLGTACPGCPHPFLPGTAGTLPLPLGWRPSAGHLLASRENASVGGTMMCRWVGGLISTLCVCGRTCVYMCACMRVSICMCVCVHMLEDVHVCTSVGIYICTRLYVYESMYK